MNSANVLVLSALAGMVSCDSSSAPAAADDSVAKALEGVVAIAASPTEYLNYYRIQLFGKYNYKSCGKQCPVTELYVSLIGEGDPPEMASFFIASGYGWKLESWEHLPESPLTESNQFVKIRLSRIAVEAPHGERQSLDVTVNFDEVRITANSAD